jgi:hypothetical protein
LLLSVIRDAELRVGGTPRIAVLGFTFDEQDVDALRELGLADLGIYKCEAFELDGQLHAGMSQLFPAAASADEHDTLGLPTAVVDPEVRRVGEQLVGILRRLDPELRAQGDRHSRRYYTSRGLLAELFVVDDRLFVTTGADEEPRPLHVGDVREIADTIVRNHLARLRDTPPGRPLRSARREEERHGAALRIDHALHPVPRSPVLGDAEVSQEEFDAFTSLAGPKERGSREHGPKER